MRGIVFVKTKKLIQFGEELAKKTVKQLTIQGNDFPLITVLTSKKLQKLFRKDFNRASVLRSAVEDYFYNQNSLKQTFESNYRGWLPNPFDEGSGIGLGLGLMLTLIGGAVEAVGAGVGLIQDHDTKTTRYLVNPSEGFTVEGGVPLFTSLVKHTRHSFERLREDYVEKEETVEVLISRKDLTKNEFLELREKFKGEGGLKMKFKVDPSDELSSEFVRAQHKFSNSKGKDSKTAPPINSPFTADGKLNWKNRNVPLYPAKDDHISTKLLSQSDLDVNLFYFGRHSISKVVADAVQHAFQGEEVMFAIKLLQTYIDPLIGWARNKFGKPNSKDSNAEMIKQTSDAIRVLNEEIAGIQTSSDHPNPFGPTQSTSSPYHRVGKSLLPSFDYKLSNELLLRGLNSVDTFLHALPTARTGVACSFAPMIAKLKVVLTGLSCARLIVIDRQAAARGDYTMADIL